MSGRWGMIPVYPWTKEEEVTSRLKEIQRVIGKKHIDFGAIRKAQVAKWLDDNYRSTRTGLHPRRNETAAAVWGRRTGLKRPSKKEAIAKLPEERERALLAHYKMKGMTHAEAEQELYKSARGKEPPASAMVRMALRRLRAKESEMRSGTVAPGNTETIALAITLLLRELPTSKSSSCNLDAIRSEL
jgi:hypothetical protein